MERITISSSLKHKEIIRDVVARLESAGVTALFPNPDSNGVAKEDVDLELMKKLEAAHFEEIDESEALYVICPEGHVGILVSVEIGFAHAKKKPIIFSERPVDLGLQALASGYVSLEKIARLKTI